MYLAPPPASSVVTADTMDWPVLALTVNAVMICEELMVTTMPSAGEAGIVTVPVASVPNGFRITVVMPVGKVYEKPVSGAWYSYDCKTPLLPSILVVMRVAPQLVVPMWGDPTQQCSRRYRQNRSASE